MSAKNKNKKNKKTLVRTQVVSVTTRPSRPKSKAPRKTGSSSDGGASAWVRLLSDPCRGPLARPCYAGTGAGYLVRTVDVHFPWFGGAFTVGTVYQGDLLFQVSPSNYSTTTGLVSGANVKGSNVTMASSGFAANFINQASVVREYRPVAQCLKWVPTGPYSTRSGVVGLVYSPGTLVTAGASVGAMSGLSSFPKINSNGSESHEVKWLPTNSDQNFTTIAAANDPGVGTLGLALSGVDGIATGVGACFFNGFVEVTTVWEWTPYFLEGLSVPIMAPPSRTSLQEVLARIGDLGRFVYGQMPMVGERLLTSGFSAAARRASPLLIQN